MPRLRIAALLAAVLGCLPGSASGAPALHVIPFPGTPDASRLSDIIFSSLTPSQITSVTVTGSSSGAHPGTLEGLPDGAGTAFVPHTAFSNGEHVSVSATLSSPAAGTASGDPGATVLRFSFVTAVPGSPPPQGHPGMGTRTVVAARAGSGPGPAESFVSEPGLHPVAVSATVDPDQSSGDIFLTPRLTIHAPRRFGNRYHAAFQGGPMIVNGRGQLVWFDPIDGAATNLEVQRYAGQPVLTWWQNTTSAGSVSHPEDVIMDRSYRTVAVVHAGYDYTPDDHEFQITPRGTALIDAHLLVRANLSSIGGPINGLLSDYVIQELDVRTGQVLWEWHALGHIPLSASYYRQPSAAQPDDFLHLNSIQVLPNGNLLMSGRHTWGVYLIDKQTGQIVWTLGGKYSSFKIGPGAQFEWQHDAHLVGHTLTLFDDASKPGSQKETQSWAKVIRLNTSAMTATLVHRYSHFPPIITSSQGSAQTLPNGNMFVGWGASPEFSEYLTGGRQIFNGSFPLGVESYRAYRFPWTGEPVTPPSVAVVPEPDGSVKVYASWNGATQVTSWRVFGETRAGKPRSLGRVPDRGFESMIQLNSEPAYLTVQALDHNGHVIGTSAKHADPAHVAIFTPQAFVNSSTGEGSLAVGCLTRRRCRLRVTLSSRGSALARSTPPHPVSPETGTLVDFKLSPDGLRRLLQSGRLPVQAQASASRGIKVQRNVTLIPYTVASPRPPRSVSQSGRVQLVETSGFVSAATGRGQILAACYAPIPCPVRVTVSAGGQVIARTGPESVGVDEVRPLSFKLSSAGRSMLQRAPGNQLPARITLAAGRSRAVGAVALVGYR